MTKMEEARKKAQRVSVREMAHAAAARATKTSPPPRTRGTSADGTADSPPGSTPADPHRLHRMILEAHQQAEDRLLVLGALLKVMDDTEAYRDLGCESFAEYVAQPELGMRKSWAYALIQAAELVQATGLNPQDVSGVEVTKLAMVSRTALKALEVGDREAAVALVEEAKVLSRSDLRARLHEDGERAGEQEDDWRVIQNLLVDTLLGRKIEAVKYDGYTLMLVIPGKVKGLQHQVRVFAPVGQRLSVKMGSV
jgi:hypothetical protein